MSGAALTAEQIDAALSGPGAPFERVYEEVGGLKMEVFKQRPRSLRDFLARSTHYGDRVFSVWDTGERWTFAEHERLVASVAAALKERHGVGPGSRVAILAANCPEWVLTAWATLSLGGTVVAMNGWWQGDEIRYGLELSEPHLLVADRKRLDRLGGADPGVPTVVVEDDFAPYRAHDLAAPLPDVAIDEDDPAAIMFTSGTTGRPKGAISTHRNLVAFVMLVMCSGARVAMANPAPEGAPELVSLASTPLFHVSGFQSCLLVGPAAGSRFVWTTGRFDEEKIFRLTLEEGVTRWGGIPTQLWRLLEHPAFDSAKFAQITASGGGGSMVSPELQRTLREKLPNAAKAISVGYGMTECGGLCTMATNEILEADPNTVGAPLPTAEVGIFDDEGHRLPDEEEGNICIRGAMVMPGYWRNPEATAEAFFPDGWLRSGDIGHMRDGLLYLASRKRDMIIRGGENVYPVEIENRLEAHPDVLEAAVVGVDHPVLGQEVKAIVVPKPGVALDPEALKPFVGEVLAYFKVPEYVEVRTEPLPRNASGKVLKPVLLGELENTFTEE